MNLGPMSLKLPNHILVSASCRHPQKTCDSSKLYHNKEDELMLKIRATAVRNPCKVEMPISAEFSVGSCESGQNAPTVIYP